MRESFTRAQGDVTDILVFSARLLTAIFFLFFSVTINRVSAQSLVPGGRSDNASQAAAQSVSPAGQAVQLEGELEILYQDSKDGHNRLSYSLRRSDGTHVPLQFTKEPPTHFLTGHRVRVSGQMSNGGLILYSGGTSVASTTTSGDATGSSTTSIPVPNTFGAQSTLVILVNFQDSPVQPFTTGDAYNAIFGTANNFIMENSYGQTSLTGNVMGWYTIPLSIATCDTSQIATAAQNAAVAAGVNLSNYTRYVYAFPQDGACGFAGASYVGGNPSQSWINGILATDVVNHELGHAFGLWHSHSLDCGTVGTICAGGTVVEYGDPIDTMGTAQTASPHYDAFQKERLGWLNYGASPQIQLVTGSGTYAISTYELGGSGANALKVLQSTDPATGAKTWYYLEARQAIGSDSFLTNSTYYTQNETCGVLFHLGKDGDGNSGDLLDMTPTTATSNGWYDMSLVVGQSFTDSTAGVTFTPTAVTGGGAAVQITMTNPGGSSCTEANPTVTLSPAQGQSVASGTAVSFTLTVTDNDSSSCPPATFSLADVLPTGWMGTWSTSPLSLSPGKSGSTTLTVTSPAGTSDGSYNIGVSAANSGASSYTGSAAATYVISAAPLSVTLSTNQTSYLPGQTVGIAVTMLYGTVPDVNASVSATVIAPNGRTTTLSGVTGSNGVASLSYKLSSSAAAGTYQVQARAGTTKSGGGGRTKTGLATVSSATTVGASTSFTVQ